ncbi:MAG: hypothetical protein SFU27_12340 [Thermonemataceae bacterium]|nr:hypothetical protein [Thermonemataceae bacterium]
MRKKISQIILKNFLSKYGLLLLFFLLKLITSLAFVWVHQNFYSKYTPDYLLIYEDALHLANLFGDNFSYFWQIIIDKPVNSQEWHLATQPRAFFAAKIFSFPALFAFKNFWLLTFYTSILTAWSLWSLAKELRRLFPSTQRASYIAFLFLPSLLFWSSATSKEAILWTILPWAFIHFWRIFEETKPIRKSFYFISLSFWIFLLWQIKYYYAFALILYIVSHTLLYFYEQHKRRKQLIFSLVSGLFVLFMASNFHPNLHLDFLPKALYENHQLILQASSPESIIYFNLQPTWVSMLTNTPQGLWAGLFAPMPWEAHNFFTFLASVENCILFAYLLFAIGSLKKYTIPFSTSFFYAISLYILLLAIFLGLSSPNMGAISRYKIGFFPFLWYILLSFQTKKIEAKKTFL